MAYFDRLDAIRVVTHTFERQRVSSRHAVDLRGVHDLDIRLIDYAVRETLFALGGYVWAQELQNDTATLEINVPATTWQMFKQRNFPGWALRRWPVRFETKQKTYRFRIKALFPAYTREVPAEMGELVLKTFVEPEAP